VVHHSFPTRRSSDLLSNIFCEAITDRIVVIPAIRITSVCFEFFGKIVTDIDTYRTCIGNTVGPSAKHTPTYTATSASTPARATRSEEHTSELQSREN